MMKAPQTDARRLATRTLVAFALILLLWTLAWALKVRLDSRFAWLTTSAGGFVFWTVAKMLLWLTPAVWLVRLSGRTSRGVWNFSHWRGWLAWGMGTGGCIALTGFIPHILRGVPPLPAAWSFALVNVLVVSPIFEEFLMRGAVFGNLRQRYSLLWANVLSSALFVALHLPGWYFMGSLAENLTRPVGGAASIFCLGLLFAYATERSRSVLGGTLAHFLNNLAA